MSWGHTTFVGVLYSKSNGMKEGWNRLCLSIVVWLFKWCPWFWSCLTPDAVGCMFLLWLWWTCCDFSFSWVVIGCWDGIDAVMGCSDGIIWTAWMVDISWLVLSLIWWPVVKHHSFSVDSLLLVIVPWTTSSIDNLHTLNLFCCTF